MNYQKDQNTVPLKEVNFEISALLENYIEKSREGKTSVLKQRSPKSIAEALQTEYYFRNGFKTTAALK
jgi:hypothetical protein